MEQITTRKRAIIIGATSGIGRAVACSLVEQGWRVGVAGRRIEELSKLQDWLGAGNVEICQMDVTSDSARNFLDDLVARIGMPDLFLYVSGVGYQNRELDIDKEIVTVKTNCEGLVRVLGQFMMHVRSASRGGTITKSNPVQIGVVTSVAGTSGLGVAPSYSATKKMQSTYITALCQLCRMEKLPVVFSDIRPGFVATDILNPNKHYPMMITPARAAEHIIEGLSKKKRVIIFDWRFSLIVLLWRLIPRPLWERLTIVRN